MKRKSTPLVVGNWKMNPTTLANAKKLFLDTRKNLGRHKIISDVVVAPPFPFISDLNKLSAHKQIALASQDIFSEPSGSYTGEVSLQMLQSVGITYTINGHSERRALGETDEDIYKDIQTSIKRNVTTIVCVGEKERDSHGHYFTVVEKQLHSAIKDVPKSKLQLLVIAYEPIWAISKGDGKGKTATPEDAHEMKLFIQKLLADKYGRKAVDAIRILYGGSVNEKNAADILERGHVDGFLVGGASLRAKEFTNIIKIADAHAKK